jgi:hypothetical protein
MHVFLFHHLVSQEVPSELTTCRKHADGHRKRFTLWANCESVQDCLFAAIRRAMADMQPASARL